MHGRAQLSLRIAAILALLAGFAACGGDDKGGGASGSGSSGGIGQACDTTSCVAGLACGGTSFRRICTVQCTNDPSCEQYDANARCFGTGPAECALRCDQDSDCPPSTHCVGVSGGTSPMACAHN
jgi:hypothetical protein